MKEAILTGLGMKGSEMSIEISVRGVCSPNNPEFKKHFEAVELCVKHDLSYPKETIEFFKNKLGGHDFKKIWKSNIIRLIQNGVFVPLKSVKNKAFGKEIHIKVSDIPKEVDTIIIK